MPVETPAPPPDPAVEAAIRKQIADGLDREAPPYIIGQMMQIETRRGRVLTGTLQRIGPEDVFVTNSEGQTLSARLSELNNASRWSVDSSARAEEIERRLKAKMSF
jgi:hypothetical protein